MVRGRERTLAQVLARVLLPRMLVFGVAASAILVGQSFGAPEAHRAGSEAATALPAWGPRDSAAFRGCVPSSAWAGGGPAPGVVVRDLRSGGDRRMAFEVAWRRNHNASAADDVWVLGVCPAAAQSSLVLD